MEEIAETVHARVEAVQTQDVRGDRCIGTVQDNSEHDFAGIQSQVTVPASSAALQAAGMDLMAWRRVASNRFFSLATDSEDERIDQWTVIDEDTCSDTVSLVERRNPRRRLSLQWSQCAPTPINPVGAQPHVPVLDSHEERLQRVREAMRHHAHDESREVRRARDMVRSLADRVGRADPNAGVIPREIRRQQWSFLNIPLMWAASSGDRSCAVLQWLARASHPAITAS